MRSPAARIVVWWLRSRPPSRVPSILKPPHLRDAAPTLQCVHLARELTASYTGPWYLKCQAKSAATHQCRAFAPAHPSTGSSSTSNTTRGRRSLDLGQEACQSARSGGTTQQIFEFDVYTKPNVPLGKLLSLYGNSEMEKYACCFSPVGCIMSDYTNIQLEYRGTNQPLDERLLNTAVGNIVTHPNQSKTLRINFHVCLGLGPLCCLIGCVSKVAGGYGDPRQNVEWLNPSRQWPLVATTAAGRRVTIKRAAATDKLGIRYGSAGGRVVVEEVDPSGICFAFGLRVGMVVVEANGKALGHDPSLLTAAMAGQTSIVLEVLDMTEEAVQPMAMAREPMGTVVEPMSHVTHGGRGGRDSPPAVQPIRYAPAAAAAGELYGLPAASQQGAVVVVPGAPVVVPGAVVLEPARAESPVSGQDTKAKMIALKQLFDEGLITEAEWTAKKAELLKNM